MLRKWIVWVGVAMTAVILLVAVVGSMPLLDSGAVKASPVRAGTEYKVIEVKYTGQGDAARIELALNSAAAEGWQLAAFYSNTLILKK